MRNYDYEFAVADVWVAYLTVRLPEEWRTVYPVVSFYDPMSTDEAGRLIVMTNNGETNLEKGLNQSGFISTEIALKTQWKQATLKDDFAKHREYLTDVRDRIANPDLLTELNAASAAAGLGLQFNHVENKRSFSTSVLGAADNSAGWIYSQMTLMSHFRVEDSIQQ